MAVKKKKKPVAKKRTQTPGLKATRTLTPKRTVARKQKPVPGARAPLPMPAALYTATPTPELVDVPARTVLALEGQGLPHGVAGPFHDAIGALYGLVYTLKFARKAKGRGEFSIGPIEARWWIADPAVPMMKAAPADFRWRLRMAVPADLTDAELRAAASAATAKGKKLAASPLPASVVRERVPAQTVARVLHVGPYDDEPRTIARVGPFLSEQGKEPSGAHLEVYLNDPRRVKPAAIKTALLLELA